MYSSSSSSSSRPPLPPLPPQHHHHHQQQQQPPARPPLPPLPPQPQPRPRPTSAAGPPLPPLPHQHQHQHQHQQPLPPPPPPAATPLMAAVTSSLQPPLPPLPPAAPGGHQIMFGSPAPNHPHAFGASSTTAYAAPTPTHPRRISTGSVASSAAPAPAPLFPTPTGAAALAPTSSYSSSTESAFSAMSISASSASATSSTSTSTSFSAAASATGLSVPLPDATSLATAREKSLALGDPHRLLQWAADVVKYVERKSTLTANSGSAAEADFTIKDPQLVGWIDEAINIINTHAKKQPNPAPRALYLRGDLLASGAFPSYHPRNLRSAFADFEMAARMGYAPAYFRCARDYEVLGDVGRAREVYEKGMGKGDVCCTYRLGMANLLGQLGVAQNLPRAVQLLRDAADRADLETPQPAYIFGIILAGEFAQVSVPVNLLMPNLVTDPNRAALSPQLSAHFDTEAFRFIARAAYLHFGPAQLKCGWAYEHAQLGCSFDPLLSVQYYILASQAGELEADLSLSKWFLCGAEGFFPKREDLAFVFADKAARKGLASAEFALGYYYEVGVGTEKNVDAARKWYRKAAAHGNSDAQERLDDLSKPQPHELSRTEHQAHVDAKLVRKRTQAQIKSAGRTPNVLHHQQQQQQQQQQAQQGGPGQQKQQEDLSRRRTMEMVDKYTGGAVAAGQRPGSGVGVGAGAAGMPMPAGWALEQAPPANRRQGRQEASLPSLPSSTSSSSSIGGGGVSGQQRVQGQHGQGYSLSESYHPQPAGAGAGAGGVMTPSASANANFGSTPTTPAQVPAPGLSSSPGRKVLAKPHPAPPAGGGLGHPGIGAGAGAGVGVGVGVPVHANAAPRPFLGGGGNAASHPPLPSNQFQSPTHAQQQQQQQQQQRPGGGRPSAGAGASGPGPGPGASSGAPVYNTFAEMGFASKPSAGEKDCVIM